MARHLRGLGALFDPNKPSKGPALVSSEVGAVISNFLATDKGAPRVVYGGCPKDVKDEIEAAAKCRFSSDRNSVDININGSLVNVANRAGRAGPGTGTIVSINPGMVNANRQQRAMANAVLRALGAGVQVEDRALLKTKEKTIGGAVLTTGNGGRVLVTGDLKVPMTEAQIRAESRPGATSALMDAIDPNIGFDPFDINSMLSRKPAKKSKKRKSRK